VLSGHLLPAVRYQVAQEGHRHDLEVPSIPSVMHSNEIKGVKNTLYIITYFVSFFWLVMTSYDDAVARSVNDLLRWRLGAVAFAGLIRLTSGARRCWRSTNCT